MKVEAHTEFKAEDAVNFNLILHVLTACIPCSILVCKCSLYVVRAHCDRSTLHA